MHSYSELITFPTFDERFNYLKLNGKIGEICWGGYEWLKTKFYSSSEWKRIRRNVILRDSDGKNVLDLAHIDHPIYGSVYIHHIVPITIDMINDRNPLVLDMNNLIAVSFNTHQAIHYGDASLLPAPDAVRRPGDTCLWGSIQHE